MLQRLVLSHHKLIQLAQPSPGAAHHIEKVIYGAIWRDMARHGAIWRDTVRYTRVVGERIAFCPARESFFRLISSPAAGSLRHDPYTIHTARFDTRTSPLTLGRCSRIDSWSPKAEHLLETCFCVVSSDTGNPEKMGSISTQALISAYLSLQ